MAGLDDGADQAGDADAIAAHQRGDRLAIRPLHAHAHRRCIFVPEIEDLAHLDALGLAQRRAAGGFGGQIALFIGGGIIGIEPIDERTERAGIIGIDGAGITRLQPVLMVEDIALAGGRQHDEFVGEIAADGAGIGLHRDGIQPHARKGAHIGDEHAVVAVAGAGKIQIEAVGILHQELAAAQHAEARAHLVAELPLDLVEVARQVAVALRAILEDGGEQFLGRGAEQHLALVPVGDAQHFRAIGIIAAGLAPQIGGLDGGHQHLDGAGAILLLAHDALDIGEHALAQRQPGIDARRGLPDHRGAQHQLVRNHLRLARRFLEDRHEIAGQAHQGFRRAGWMNAALAWLAQTASRGRERLLHLRHSFSFRGRARAAPA